MDMKSFAKRLHHHANELMFVGGFIFDYLTIRRIDALADIGMQLLYLSIVTAFLIWQYRELRVGWTPPAFLAKWWHYNVEALHFCYGGLLSSYVVLYFQSSTGARPLVFFLFLVVLLFLNEMPQVRRAGHRMRLGLYAFCVLSFMNFFIPIIIGRMGGWVFALALLVTTGVVWRVADWLAAFDENRAQSRQRLFAPAGAVIAIIGALYVLRLIPPVPLSVQFQGLYHDVQRVNGRYELIYERPSTLDFWRHDSRPFRARPGDRLCYFARVFAPSRFRHQVIIRWELRDPVRKTWQTSDRIPLYILGGRAEGFRGVAIKSNFVPGRWRVTAETDDERPISILTFDVILDEGTDERRWKTTRE